MLTYNNMSPLRKTDQITCVPNNEFFFTSFGILIFKSLAAIKQYNSAGIINYLNPDHNLIKNYSVLRNFC
jgi:hypothetical protein